MAKQKHISLKEAAEISGYSPDYIGQLIRAGKLPGEQVFLNVAWVTTEAAVRTYIEKNKKGMTQRANPWIEFRNKILSPDGFDIAYKVVLGAIIGLIGIFVLFLVGVLSVSIDRHINKNYEIQLQKEL